MSQTQSKMLSMQALQEGYFQELLNFAYQQVGDAPLTEEQETNLRNACWTQVQQASYPPTTALPVLLNSASGKEESI